MAKYTQGNIEFSKVKPSGIHLSSGPITVGSQVGINMFGGIINAVDIDWNHGYLPHIQTYIDTTGDLLSQIDNIYEQLSNINSGEDNNYVTVEYLENNYATQDSLNNISNILDQKANLNDIPQYISDLQGYNSLATITWVNNQLRYYSRSAYDVYVENGGTLTQQEWLDSLHGTNGLNGKSAYELAKYYNQTTLSELEWVQSLPGRNGYSAFELAQQNDPSLLSVEQWLESLKGKRGDPGNDGKSAYEQAVDNGFIGTEQQWIESLKGEKGDPGASINILGYFDTLEELKAATAETINSLGDAYNVGGRFYVYNDEYTSIDDKWKPAGTLQGPEGKSAYMVATDNGFEGTEQEWLQSLQGPTGISAYEIAKSFDPSIGTEQEWLQSLKGEQGKSAYDVYVEIQQALNKEYLTPEEWAANMETQGITYSAGTGISITNNVISVIEKRASDIWAIE